MRIYRKVKIAPLQILYSFSPHINKIHFAANLSPELAPFDYWNAPSVSARDVSFICDIASLMSAVNEAVVNSRTSWKKPCAINKRSAQKPKLMDSCGYLNSNIIPLRPNSSLLFVTCDTKRILIYKKIVIAVNL